MKISDNGVCATGIRRTVPCHQEISEVREGNAVLGLGLRASRFEACVCGY